MKKYLCMAVAAIAALSSCSNEDEIVATENSKGEPIFYATMEDGDATRVKLNGNTPKWQGGDAISIDGHTYTVAIDVATTTGVFMGSGATEPVHHAFYPASMYDNGKVTLPASYTYVANRFDMPMYAESTTIELPFKNLCGVLAITVPSTAMDSVTSIVVSSNRQMNGEISTITADGVLTFKSGTLTSAEKKVTLKVSPAVTIPTGGEKTFYVPVPAGTKSLKISVSDGTTKKVMKTKKSGGVQIERNKIYSILFEHNYEPLLPGSFSVSATKKVHFAKNNLYWDGSEFMFEDNPIDFETTRSADHMSHFFWTKTAAASYAETYADGTITNEDKFFADGSDDAHKLTVEGVSGLYVLSLDEWKYLVGYQVAGRDNAATLYKKNVSVDGVKCVVIAPDNYLGQLKTSYTLEEVDTEGLLCLPIAGQFTGGTSYNSTLGSYCSSTPRTDSASNYVYWLGFSTSALQTPSTGTRNCARSIRLVK